jgi:hypothetical protein
VNRNLLRRIERLEQARSTRGAFVLAWQDGDQLIGTQASPPAAPVDGPNQQSPATTPLYRRRVPYSRYPSQQKFDASSAAVKGFSGPIGSGKSKAQCHEAIKCANLNHGVTGLIGGPTYRLLNDSTILELLATLEEHGIPHQWLKASQTLQLTEPNSTILVRSLEHPERLRAMNLGWFGVDELSYCKEAAWVRLEGRLRHPGAPAQTGFCRVDAQRQGLGVAALHFGAQDPGI